MAGYHALDHAMDALPYDAPAQTAHETAAPLFGRRWYVLFVASLVAFTQGWVWNTYGPIAITVERNDTFGWRDGDISLLGNWGPIAYAIAFLPTAWLLDTYHLRPSTFVASSFVFAGCAVRLMRVDDSAVSLLLQHVGQCLNGLAGPFSLSAGTVISAAWFPRYQRTTSTAIFTVANMLGVSSSFLLGPFMVPADGTVMDVHRYLWVCFWLSAVALALVLVYLPSRPPVGSEPSRSSGMKRLPLCAGLRALASHRHFWLVAVSYGTMAGLYAGWIPLFALIIKKLGPTIAPHPQSTASWIGFWSNLGGNLGGMLLSLIADSRGLKRNQFRGLLVGLSLAGVLVYAAFAVQVARGQLTLTSMWVLCILGGVVVNSGVPLFYELAVDAAFPVAEGLSTAVMTMMHDITELIFLVLPSAGLEIGNWVNYSVGGACAVSLLCMLHFRGQLARSKEDSKDVRQSRQLSLQSHTMASAMLHEGTLLDENSPFQF